jgi:radical SAM superfamily enzyme YgiQ (UPF0313 family)
LQEKTPPEYFAALAMVHYDLQATDMARKILLISTNRCEMPDPVFPLGLAHINAALRRAGYTTRWQDMLVDKEPLEKVLREYRPNYVGISIRNIDDVLIRKRHTFFEFPAELAEAVRRINPCPIILGGSGFSLFPQQLLKRTGADFGIRGDGETSLVQLLAALETGSSIHKIPGLVFKQNGEIQTNPPSGSADAVTFSHDDMPSRLTQFYLDKGAMLNLQSQRGCQFRCCYCTYPLIEGRASRCRPSEQVADEMEFLQRRGARYVFLVDSIFNTSEEHVTRVCESFLKRNLSLKWGCFLRPQGLTSKLVKLMARAGLAHAEFGSDSFCDDVLQAYDKDFTFADILESSERIRQERIDYCHFLICGGPGESLATLQTSFRNSQRLKDPVILAVVGLRVYPETALCRRLVGQGWFPADQDWLQPVFALAPELTEDAVFAQLQGFARRSPHWIIGDPTPAYGKLVQRLRQRGIAGPLWSYMSMLQRIMPSAPVVS